MCGFWTSPAILRPAGARKNTPEFEFIDNFRFGLTEVSMYHRSYK